MFYGRSGICEIRRFCSRDTCLETCEQRPTIGGNPSLGTSQTIKHALCGSRFFDRRELRQQRLCCLSSLLSKNLLRVHLSVGFEKESRNTMRPNATQKLDNTATVRLTRQAVPGMKRDPNPWACQSARPSWTALDRDRAGRHARRAGSSRRPACYRRC